MNVSKYALNQRFFLAKETDELFYLEMESWRRPDLVKLAWNQPSIYPLSIVLFLSKHWEIWKIFLPNPKIIIFFNFSCFKSQHARLTNGLILYLLLLWFMHPWLGNFYTLPPTFWWFYSLPCHFPFLVIFFLSSFNMPIPS